jgi:hypothetical protein
MAGLRSLWNRRTLAGFAGLLLSAGCGQAPVSQTVDATVTRRVRVEGVRPFGVNLGNWTFWGAEQLVSNVIKNPGFEGLIDGAMAIPQHSGGETFDDSPNWLARGSGFWEGARYSIRSGPHAGKEGTIVSSSGKGPGGLPVFTVARGDTVPDFGAAVALIKDTEDTLPTQWWFSKGAGSDFSPATGLTRPGSPGIRSLRVTASGEEPAEVASYLDTLGGRGGKMLPLDGPWTLSFWARLEKGQASLHVVLGREKSPPSLSREAPLTGAWRNFRYTFEGKDYGPPGPVSLRFRVGGRPLGQVLLDDVELRRNEDARLPFRREAVAALRSLHPGYLRDWQGQLGDTLANRIAPAFARKSYRYRPGTDSRNGGDAQTDFGYGMGDFLDLAKEVDASPWIVIPPTFSDSDCEGLGDFLTGRRLPRSREVLVEFGNESWNELFRPGGIPDPVMYGQSADRCFAAIRRHAGGIGLRTVLGVQFANPDGALRFAQESKEADVVSFAPYFTYSVPAGLALEARIPLLFQPEPARLTDVTAGIASLKKEAAVYEVNLHATGGDAPAEERLPLVAGMASGTALAANMMESLAHGVRRQCVYALAGYDFELPGTHRYTPLWGIVRDLGATHRLRPTGLALQLMNRVLQGDLRVVEQRGPGDVAVYAFASRGVTHGQRAAGETLSMLAVSASAKNRSVTLHLPENQRTGEGWRLLRLTGTSPASTNEDSEQVRMVEENLTQSGDQVSFALKPWSMAVIERSGRERENDSSH